MGYSTDEGRVRVSIFKPSGKWYSDASVDMSGHYTTPDIFGALLAACLEEHSREGGQWELTTSPHDLLAEGWYLVCLEPYHKHAHPIMLTKGRVRAPE